MCTVRYALNPYIKGTRFIFKGLKESLIQHRPTEEHCNQTELFGLL